MTQPDISVFGAGSYGTALAIQLARNGARVALWGRDAAALERIGAEGVNARYLPDCPFLDRCPACLYGWARQVLTYRETGHNPKKLVFVACFRVAHRTRPCYL